MPQQEEVRAGDRNEQDILDEQFAKEDAEASAEAQKEAEKVEEPVVEPVKTEETIETEPSKERPVYTMSVSKAQKEKDKAVERARLETEEKIKADYEAKIESLRAEYESKLSQGKPVTAVDEKLRKFAEEKGLDADSARGLLDIFKESIQLPDLSKYDALVKQQEIELHKAEVSREFDEQVIPLIKKDFPSATPSHINKIKKEIEQLAFTQRFNTYPIADIYAVNKGQFEVKNSYTAEDSGGRTVNETNIADLSEEEAMKLSPEKYTEWMDVQARKQSPFIEVK